MDGENKKSTGGRLKFGLFRFVIGLIIIALIAVGLNVIHQHSSFFAKGETINLDEKQGKKEDYPLNEFVHADVLAVIDVFARRNSSLNGIPTGQDTFYLVVLRNLDLIAVKASSADDIAILNKGVEAYLNRNVADNASDTIIPIEGKLIDMKMVDYRVKTAFDNALNHVNVKSAFDGTVNPRRYIIDMTAARVSNVLIYVVIPVVVVILLIAGTVLIVKKRKKKKENSSADQ